MINRKKKLRIYQSILLIIGIFVVLYTYSKKNNPNQEKIISNSLQEKIEKQLQNKEIKDGNTFYNVKYSGLDLGGNRYSILAEEGTSSEFKSNIVNMKGVNATFYFKDGTILIISCDQGEYNNKTLDMTFKGNVKALYNESELYADRAEFSNSENFLTVSRNVKIIDTRGNIFADKLLFDLKDKTLNITSLENNVVKSTINHK